MDKTLLARLAEERKALADKAQALLTAAAAEKRELTQAEATEFDAIHDDIDRRLEPAIARLLRAEKLAQRNAEILPLIAANEDIKDRDTRKRFSADPAERREQERKALHALLRFGPDALAPEERGLFGQHSVGPAEVRALFEKGLSLGSEDAAMQGVIQRALAAGTGNVGGYTVPTTLVPELLQVMTDSSGLLQVCRQLPTTSGNKMDWPTFDDTSERGELVAEAAAHTADSSTPFGQQTMDAYVLGSKLVRVSLQLLQDSSLDVESTVTSALAGRLGRGINYYATLGTGSSQPNGIVTASTLAVTGASGQTTSITWDDLVDVQGEAGQRHALAAGAGWMVNWKGRSILKKMKNADGTPLWQSGNVARKEPDTLDGYPVYYNNDIAVPAAGAKSLLFGNYKAFTVRLVRDITLVRFSETYMANLQVGFLAFIRFDSELMDAGDGSVVHYKQAAS